MQISLGENCFYEFLKLIHEVTGITISANRASMVEGRLRKRVIALKLKSYEEYLNFVKKDREERERFIDVVTTNETSFFRTPRVWEYIENQFLPKWSISNPNKVFLAWSAAASSGEEAHSLAVICQAFKEVTAGFEYKITGTDISGEMINRCKKGDYSGRALEYFQKNKTECFKKYMKSAEGESFRALSEIRNHLHFEQHNLFYPSRLASKFDLILVRNVLIYFCPSDQETVLSLLAPKLKDAGVS